MIKRDKTLVYSNHSFPAKERFLKREKGEKILIIFLTEEGHLKLNIFFKIKNIEHKIENRF